MRPRLIAQSRHRDGQCRFGLGIPSMVDRRRLRRKPARFVEAPHRRRLPPPLPEVLPPRWILAAYLTSSPSFFALPSRPRSSLAPMAPMAKRLTW